MCRAWQRESRPVAWKAHQPLHTLFIRPMLIACSAVYIRARNHISRARFCPMSRTIWVLPYPASNDPTLGPVCPKIPLSAEICTPQPPNYRDLFRPAPLRTAVHSPPSLGDPADYASECIHRLLLRGNRATAAVHGGVLQAGGLGHTVRSQTIWRMWPPPTA